MIRSTLLALAIAPALICAAPKQPMRRIECQLIPQNIAASDLVCRNAWKKKQLRLQPKVAHSAIGTGQIWGGYVAAPHIHRQHKYVVEEVSGSWIAPAITGPGATNYYTNVDLWVGIDGFFNNTVEQLGTEHDWVQRNDGSWGPQHFAWIEMFPTYPATLAQFPVDAGDHIFAKVKYKGNGLFLLLIGNKTKNVWTSVTSTLQSQFKALRSSAEWIVESEVVDDGIPLTNFGVVNFYNCKAKIKGHRGSIGDSHWRNEQMTIVDLAGTTLATPSALFHKGQNFNMTFVQNQ